MSKSTLLWFVKIFSIKDTKFQIGNIKNYLFSYIFEIFPLKIRVNQGVKPRKLRNRNLSKTRVNQIRVNRIRVNQGVPVIYNTISFG